CNNRIADAKLFYRTFNVLWKSFSYPSRAKKSKNGIFVRLYVKMNLRKLYRMEIPYMEEARFQLVSSFEPQGDQPKAIKELVKQVNEGRRHITLLGATGTGKTFTVSNVIAQVNRPTLVIAHNKTLAGQLYSEFKEFFPHNAV